MSGYLPDIEGTQELHFWIGDPNANVNAIELVNNNGTLSLPPIAISGGTIDNSVIGAITPVNGTFTNLTATSSLTLSVPSSNATIAISGAVGQERGFRFYTAGSPNSIRAIFRVNAEAESGGNTGSNVELYTFLDDGATANQIFKVLRNNGATTWNNLVTFASDLAHTGSNAGFFGHAVHAQPTAGGVVAGFVQNPGLGTSVFYVASTSTGGIGASAYTFGDVVALLKNLGFAAA